VQAIAAPRPFATAADLLGALREVLTAVDAEGRLAILKAHPELAGLAARSGSMTAESVSEQQGAGLSTLSDERVRLFDELNAAYRARFGFPFIIAVRRHGVDSILSEFRRRVALGPDEEAGTALAEVMRIVALRLDALVDGADLPVSGRISTHVLDSAAGIPAAGVAVELVELSGEGERVVARAVTNAGGRTDAPLIAGRPVPIATYELRFALGAYHRSRGLAVASPAFLETVPIRFGVAEPEGHYHVPLVATPWAYQTYRGS
jgi:2-oxo-4-hydroxy-4-carboxy-5-ureidoimidazoline decarboxylase